MFVVPSVQLEPDLSRSHAASVAESMREWESFGFQRVQVVITSVDARILDLIMREAHGPVQVVGPIESWDDVDAVLATGPNYAVLGARALEDPDWLGSIAGRFPGQLIVSSPARERRMRSRGAVRTLPHDLRDIAAEFAGLPLGGLIVEFPPDAEMDHADLALVEDVVENSGLPVLVSGATYTLASLRDLEFRGASAVIIATAQLSAAFDEQLLARSFSD